MVEAGHEEGIRGEFEVRKNGRREVKSGSRFEVESWIEEN
jgi:hypothetical protein